jgi:hypothetical protein
MNTCSQEEFHGPAAPAIRFHVFRDGDMAAPNRSNSDAGARVILLGAKILDERGDPEHHERQDDEANKCHRHRHPG